MLKRTYCSDNEEHDGLRLILDKGRAHKVDGGRYVCLKLFTTERAEAELVCSLFGGNIYTRRDGFEWVVGNKRELTNVATLLGQMTSSGRSNERLRPLLELVNVEAGSLVLAIG